MSDSDAVRQFQFGHGLAGLAEHAGPVLPLCDEADLPGFSDIQSVLRRPSLAPRVFCPPCHNPPAAQVRDAGNRPIAFLFCSGSNLK
jgi:hypothetical protein